MGFYFMAIGYDRYILINTSLFPTHVLENYTEAQITQPQIINTYIQLKAKIPGKQYIFCLLKILSKPLNVKNI